MYVDETLPDCIVVLSGIVKRSEVAYDARNK